MRPLPGGDALPPQLKPRSRKSSVDHPAVASSNVPTAFFLRREEEIDQSPPTSSSSTNTLGKHRGETYGVQSLEDTLEAAFGPESTTATTHKLEDVSSASKDYGKAGTSQSSHGSSTNSVGSPDRSKLSSARKSKRTVSSHTRSASPTYAPPPSITPAIASTPSGASVNSIKLSDEDSTADELASQAITSSGEDEGEDLDTQPGASSSFPQLVMPSIQMPARRPFTTKGKAMGKFKVLVAGENGVGKTSLIRSIVQVCEDIVHVDSLSPSNSISQPSPPKSRSRRRKSNYMGTTKVTEIHASTKPYPHWWTDLEDSGSYRRRRSGVDSVLERNITFVDTPGFPSGSTTREDMALVVDYVESLLYQMTSVPTMEDSDILSVVSGSGGNSVDLVFYLLPPNKDISEDIDYMQRLSSLTNVIPVIAKSDTLTAQEVVALKTSILARLQTSSIRPFFFGKPLDDALLAVQGLSIIHPTSTSTEPEQYPFSTPTYPYAISSTPGPDNETMDASLLMSPDYVQPLLPSELTALVSQVFDPESIAWLRHAAAKKFLLWRKRTKLPGESFILHSLQQVRSPAAASVGLNGATMTTSANSSVFSAVSPSGVLVPRSGSPFYTSNAQSPFLATSPSLAQSDLESPTDFSLTRYNIGQGDAPLPDIRIAKWATDLQRSLRNERDRFEELQRNDRAKWLLERVGEEVSRGTIVATPGGSPRAEWAVVRHVDEKGAEKVGHRYSKASPLDSRDPLGLCSFGDEVKRSGFVLFKVLGGVSVLGAVTVAIVRACGLETGLPQNAWWNWLTGGAE